MENIKIRDFKDSDVNEVIKIHNENADNFESFEVNPEFLISIASRNDFRFLIAESTEDEDILGFIGILFHKAVGRAELGPIGVKNSHKKKGIGRKLTISSFEFLKEEKIHRVISKIKKTNYPAIEFFRSIGFLNEATFKNYTKKGEDIIQMVRFL